jgi:hypothetical protein
MALLKLHSHPDGQQRFSQTDDASDRDLFASVFGWIDRAAAHASAVMVPDGMIFGRAVLPTGEMVPLDVVCVAGDDLAFWHARLEGAGREEFPSEDHFSVRTKQAFGGGTVDRLGRLSAGVVGCSGTGSIVAELLARLGIGRLLLVDPDVVEGKNLSRILNATRADADARRPKVQVVGTALSKIGLGTQVNIVPAHLSTPEAIRAVASCDVVFGCMDSVEGRHVLNRLAAFYLLPYFDVGVRIDADGQGGVSQLCAAVNYVQPDGSSLLSRGVYTMDDVCAEAIKRTNPQEYASRRSEGYLRGVREDRPAVISVNALAASHAVNEFLARLHPYRLDPNREFARVAVSLTGSFMLTEPEGAPENAFAAFVGRADTDPLLQMPELSGP